ncbi:MAG TPA: FAD-linked oxidase C-terminal domain-containing protein [Segeticoccus sp.]|nr:FAD-linked oxidase C-terminal domain-containing protein [Segeticoccus sp.]
MPPGHTFVLVEYGGGTQEESDRAARALVQRLEEVHDDGAANLISDPQAQEDVWDLRKGAIGSTKIPGEHAAYAGWEDAAVHPSELSGYLRDFRALVDGYGYHTVLFGHFGQGCIHNRLDLDIATQSGIDTFGRFLSDAADLVVRYGGSLSGEHGDGQLRAAFLPRMFGPELVGAFERFKDLFDPDGLMNPGKVVRPNSPTANLRLGVDYRPPELETHFSFAQDGGWAGAADRCFGVGKCRHMDGGTMCPSFMVTREEKNSTRGRARMLFEMMQTAGERKDPWRDDGVKDALHLCLACKGCKGDCPVRVDMATYKAEFLSHYYEGRLRPRTAYAMGLIQQWARLASLAPKVVNRVGSSRLTAPLLKLAGGVAQARQIPQFADRTFRAGLDGRRLPGQGEPVVLWTDTFTNHFQPAVAEAALRVLGAAGFAVQVPGRQLCCGRPLYDYGMLTTARRYLEQVLAALRPQVEAGLPVVGLEPSCVAVFRDELPGMLPDDPLARRLSEQTLTLAELLERHAPGWQPPRLERRALVQVHCHQGAVIGHDSEEALLRRVGLDVEVPDSGCCGMAGSFGYEAGERYEVSIACGERVILPKVREADEDTLVVADGFSCREQIEQTTDRRAVHLAQVLDLALGEHNG